MCGASKIRRTLACDLPGLARTRYSKSEAAAAVEAARVEEAATAAEAAAAVEAAGVEEAATAAAAAEAEAAAAAEAVRVEALRVEEAATAAEEGHAAAVEAARVEEHLRRSRQVGAMRYMECVTLLGSTSIMRSPAGPTG